jgi:hypothetical protein
MPCGRPSLNRPDGRSRVKSVITTLEPRYNYPFNYKILAIKNLISSPSVVDCLVKIPSNNKTLVPPYTTLYRVLVYYHICHSYDSRFSDPLGQGCSTFCLPQVTFLFSSKGGFTSLNMKLYCTVLIVLYLLCCT